MNYREKVFLIFFIYFTVGFLTTNWGSDNTSRFICMILSSLSAMGFVWQKEEKTTKDTNEKNG